jgi:YggT family protein
MKMSGNQTDDYIIERKKDLLHDEDAFLLYQEEKRLRKARLKNAFTWIINSISWLGGALEILLGARLMLRLLGANSQNEFAQWTNNLSAPFVAPFSTLFVNPTLGNKANVLDINIMIAMVIYALLTYSAISLVRFIFYRAP